MIHYPVKLAGVTTRVLEAGFAPGPDRVGDRPLAVLVHGVGARADRWIHNVDALAAAGYRVVAFDLPGHGLADKASDGTYTVPAFADLVDAVIDRYEAPDAHLVGTSLGGHVVGVAAARRPERVRSLTLVGTVGMVPLGEDRRAATGGRLGAATRDGVVRKFGVLVHDQSLVTEDWIREEILVNSSPGAAEALRAMGSYFTHHLDDDVVGPQLGELCSAGRFPVLIVWGEEEIAFPLAMGLDAWRVVAGSSLVTLAATAHAPYLERPDAFNAVLTDFWAGSLGRTMAPGIAYHQR